MKILYYIKISFIIKIFLVVLLLFINYSFAATTKVDSNLYIMKDMKVDLGDNISMQRGMKYFMEYCQGCHSLKYHRYSRSAKDLKINEDIMKKYLLVGKQKFNGNMLSGLHNIPKKELKKWFGVSPPDLTLIIKLRGAKWVYNYLQAFYKDDSRPWGFNNAVFDKVAMPNVFARVQGIQEIGCGYREKLDKSGKKQIDALTGEVYLEEKCGMIVNNSTGMVEEANFQQMVYDITNFLAYVSEPHKLKSRYVGAWVLFFMVFLILFTWMLKQEYWRYVK